MESLNHGDAPFPHGSSSRPTIAFPIGTVLLLLVIFGLSGILSFCYHWEKRRHITSRRTARVEAGALDVGHCKPQALHMNLKLPKNNGLPVVVMPGDNVPKFIALPCPRLEKIIVDVPPPPPPKPLRTVFRLI
ncbi:uncharacterized protein At5g65660-like [Primulina eburnea]|uniref:uncharacterized protein At5g65660-like n=1 Tax=Primulina eburnea TaxID=1245227 RepID=UPI003C6C8255